MKIHLLGTGTPILDPERPATTAILVEIGLEKLLFDAGRGLTTGLLRKNIHPATVDTLFITHHHYDHICDLGEFLLTAWHNGQVTPIQIFGPPGTAQIVDALFNQVYARDIAFTLFLGGKDQIDIRDLVKTTDITPGLVSQTPTWRVWAEYVNHGNSLGLSQGDWPCLGYRLEAGDKTLAIGGDTVACEGLDRLAQDADALILSCYLADAELQSPPFQQLAQHIIAASSQAGQIATRAGVQKLILTHFRKKSAELMRSLEADVRANFAGEVYMGEESMMIEV